MAGEAQAGDIHKESGEESGSNGALQELFEDPPPQRCEQCWVSPGSVGEMFYFFRCGLVLPERFLHAPRFHRRLSRACYKMYVRVRSRADF